VWAVWAVVGAGFLVPWLVFFVFDAECEAPCDGPTYVFLGLLQVGVLIPAAAKLVWVVRARVRRSS
jgi:hypothetical protein